MASTINTNINSLTAQRNLGVNQMSLSTSMQRLSSGLRINGAKDDAAGLAISDRMTSQIKGLAQAARNANDAISLTQTAEGALSSVTSNLQRIRELAVQAANGTNSASDRLAIKNEVTQLNAEIERVATTTQFNGINLLDGTLTSTTFQVGANNNQTISLGIGSTKGADLASYSVSSAGALSNAVIGAANTGAGTAVKINANGKSETASFLAADTAKTIAGAINSKSDEKGLNVVATASTKMTISGFLAADIGTISFTLKGKNATAVAVAATITSQLDLGEIAKAINAQSSTTGITATADKVGNLVLKNDEGVDISLTGVAGFTTATATGATGAATAAIALTTATVGGTVKITSKAGFSVDQTGTEVFSAAAGITNSTANKLSEIDVSTIDGAGSAIQVVDAALALVGDQRAALGAYQNRFETTVGNLLTTTENLTASRSRILDADFAVETANLSRSQILQQAGTAMVAQANQLPQGVLALLR